MPYQHLIRIVIASAAVGLFLAFTLPLLETQKAQATPALAKGRPCSDCHTGSPPTKKNVKKK